MRDARWIVGPTLCGLVVLVTACAGGLPDGGAPPAVPPSAAVTGNATARDPDSDPANPTSPENPEHDRMIPGEPEGLDLLSEECLDIAMAMAAITRASALEMFYGRASGDHPSSAIEDMRGRIPVEIRDDFDIWMDALLDYARIIAGIDVPVTSGDDSSGTDRAMPSQVTSDDPLADPLVVEAQANVSAYLDARCPPVGRSSDEMG